MFKDVHNINAEEWFYDLAVHKHVFGGGIVALTQTIHGSLQPIPLPKVQLPHKC